MGERSASLIPLMACALFVAAVAGVLAWPLGWEISALCVALGAAAGALGMGAYLALRGP